jgi:hypothetical protein
MSATAGELLSAVAEIAVWTKGLQDTLGSGGPTDVVHALVQMGVDDPNPGKCKCDMEWVKRDPPETLWPWLHNNHRAYNRMVWEMIPKGEFPRLRRVLRDDRKTNYSYGKEPAPAPSGKIVTHEYAQQLLDHFLWADEAKADWI